MVECFKRFSGNTHHVMDCFPSVHVGMAVKSARQTLPRTLMPVINSMLANMSGLGFNGLFLGVTLMESWGML